MTLKNYLFIMGVLTVICLGIFIFVLNLIDPSLTNWIGFLLFYFSLFLFLSGLISLIGFIIRFVILRKGLAFNSVKKAFRQSFLFSLFIIFLLMLKAQQVFNWVNLTLLIIIFLILELFLISHKKNRQ